jgi:hypothetical protein
MELGELIAPPAVHTEPNEDCPFCPPPEFKKYTTYPGKANDSKILAAVMEKPASLTDKQSNARPQTGRVDEKGYTQEQPKPAAREQNTTKFYTFQAHHLISGKQALQGSPMEHWIVGGEKIEKDTGYSVNSTSDGFWAPSVPKEYVGRWGKGKKVLTDEQRQELAEKVMADAGAQTHIGPHNISDPDDPDGYRHKSYDKYIKDWLRDISKRIEAWSQVCAFCNKGDGSKPQTTHAVHDVLDRLSSHLKNEITGSRETWKIFLSTYAMNYHKPVCTHKRFRP